MAAGEEIEQQQQKLPFLHCEPERDMVHRLQSIHITLLGKNIIPAEIQQFTTSPAQGPSSASSQCRVLPASLERPSGSCWQHGTYSLGHSPQFTTRSP